MTSSNGTCFLFDVLSVSYGPNVSAFDDAYMVDIDINMRRNGEAIDFNTTLKADFPSDSIRFVYFTINNWNYNYIISNILRVRF